MFYGAVDISVLASQKNRNRREIAAFSNRKTQDRQKVARKSQKNCSDVLRRGIKIAAFTRFQNRSFVGALRFPYTRQPWNHLVGSSFAIDGLNEALRSDLHIGFVGMLHVPGGKNSITCLLSGQGGKENAPALSPHLKPESQAVLQ